MANEQCVKISWKFNDGADHYEQLFNGEDSIDKCIDIWIDLYTDDRDCNNPLDYCDWFDIKLVN